MRSSSLRQVSGMQLWTVRRYCSNIVQGFLLMHSPQSYSKKIWRAVPRPFPRVPLARPQAVPQVPRVPRARLVVVLFFGGGGRGVVDVVASSVNPKLAQMVLDCLPGVFPFCLLERVPCSWKGSGSAILVTNLETLLWFSPCPMLIWVLQSSHWSKIRVAQDWGRRGANWSENEDVRSECKKCGENSRQMAPVSTICDEYCI